MSVDFDFVPLGQFAELGIAAEHSLPSLSPLPLSLSLPCDLLLPLLFLGDSARIVSYFNINNCFTATAKWSCDITRSQIADRPSSIVDRGKGLISPLFWAQSITIDQAAGAGKEGEQGHGASSAYAGNAGPVNRGARAISVDRSDRKSLWALWQHHSKVNASCRSAKLPICWSTRRH